MLVIKLSLVLSTLLSLGSRTLAYVAHGTSPKNGQPLPDLLYATIDDLQLGLAAGTFTSVDLVKAYLARINERLWTPKERVDPLEESCMVFQYASRITLRH